jgi:hypothetical protein
MAVFVCAIRRMRQPNRPGRLGMEMEIHNHSYRYWNDDCVSFMLEQSCGWGLKKIGVALDWRLFQNGSISMKGQ